MAGLQKIIYYLAQNGIFNMVNETMAKHTSFRIGGMADVVVYPTRRKEICDLVKICKAEGVPYTVLGNGTNVLISDKGIRGLIIMTDRLSRVTVKDDGTIEAWAGASLARVANLAKNYSLTGMEFAYGIPGSIGGAIYMNAGAYNRQMCNIVYETEYIDGEGNIKTLKGEEHNFGYRHSFFRENEGIVTRTILKLSEGDLLEIMSKMNEYTTLRNEKQPLDKPSAGSVFKRPEGYFAGKLIEDCGLKGASVGGAMVSPKHAGFIVNEGGATCADVCALVAKVKETVKEQFGVELQEEIKVIGEK